MILPIPKTYSEDLNGGNNLLDEGLSEGLNEGLKSVLGIIKSNPGIQANKISELLNNRAIKTLERQIKTLEKRLIERRGSKKTGGYFVIKNAG